MSGICGVFSPRHRDLASREILNKMLDAIQHRGKAARRSYVDDQAGIALGHVFAPTFQAPDEEKTPPWFEDGDFVATLDGAIFNATDFLPPEWRQHHPNRDTAGALAHLKQSPADFPAKLDGHYSLAIWDKKQRHLRLMRDPLGGKPLYWCQLAGKGAMIFASELKGILAHPAVERRLSREALSSYLTFGFVLAPLSIFEGIQKSFPGEILACDAAGHLAQRQFWTMPPIDPQSGMLDTFAAQLRERMIQTVAKHVEGAQQLGVYFSGGIESTIVLGVLKLLGIADIHTFTLGFHNDPEKTRLSEDLHWAGHLAKTFGVPHHPIIIEHGHDPRPLLPSIFRQFDEPMLTPNCYTKYLLAEAAHKAGLNSCVSGSNAEPSFQRTWAKTIQKVQAAIGAHASFEEFFLFDRTKLFTLEEQAELLTEPLAEARELAFQLIRRYSEGVEAEYIGDRLDGTLLRMQDAEKALAVQDRTAALLGMEVRHPYHDAQLFEFANLIPARFKGSESSEMTKAVLIAAFKDLLPNEIITRKKRGFPSYYWNRGEIDNLVQRLLSPQAVERTGLFRSDMVQRILAADKISSKKSAGQRTWGLLAIQAWYELYLNNSDGSFMAE